MKKAQTPLNAKRDGYSIGLGAALSARGRVGRVLCAVSSVLYSLLFTAL